MLYYDKKARNRKSAATIPAGYYTEEPAKGKKQNKKMTSMMAMILGMILTLEIIVAGGMILNIDFYSADRITLLFSFVVVYFAVVAFLAEK